MQSQRTTLISPAEWRWVFIIGGALAAMTLLPYAWALAANATATEWQFMGFLANPHEGATYLATIGQGMRGAWLLHYVHTPEPHTGAAIQFFYLLLGHVARWMGVSAILIYHMARVLTTLFMFTALYQFGATVWTRLRPRRLFFGMISIGSGLGWLLLLLDSSIPNLPDVTVPEAFPLYAAYAAPHFPLTIGVLALLAANYVTVFRIDFDEMPTVTNGGLAVILLTVLIAIVLPQAMVPLGVGLAVYLSVRFYSRRAISLPELTWFGLFAFPAGVFAAYYYAVLAFNPAMAASNAQVQTSGISPLLVLVGYGLLLLTAIPGLWRAIRQFEEDGDQLMLIWLLVNFVLVFWPSNYQRRFMTGLIIPVTFFAVRSLEDYWLRRFPPGQENLRNAVMLVLIVFLMPSNILALGVPLFGLFNPADGLEQRLLVEHGYWEAMVWLDEHGTPDEVVLSSPNVGLWIPAWGGKRVVYGHPWETLDAETKLAEVEAWYRGEGCEALLAAYGVDYVVVGPQELALGEGFPAADACYADLESRSVQVETFDDVTVYTLASE